MTLWTNERGVRRAGKLARPFMYQFLIVIKYWTDEKRGIFTINELYYNGRNMTAAQDYAWDWATRHNKKVDTIEIYRLGLNGGVIDGV